MFAEDEAALLHEAATSPEHLEELVTQRVSGLPLEHVVGWAEFCGQRITITKGVFVPRHRTELLVDLATDLNPATVVDLCCGSGAVGAVLQHRLPKATVYAADIDPVAVACARKNLTNVFEGDLFDALPTHLRGHIDVVVANVPYVPTDDIQFMPTEARDYEARVALDGGADGLEVMRRVAAQAADWLRPGGHLMSETSARQAAAALAAFSAAGFEAKLVTSEDATAVTGVKPA
ncbi:release factor glutamine methyltransferase [Lentzea flava]|nr:release factor glutamine methyltransferase [Lentzea flava]